MCAGDELDFLVPRRVAALFGRALRVASEKAGRPLSPSEGLLEIARHFNSTWSARRARLHPGDDESPRPRAGNVRGGW